MATVDEFLAMGGVGTVRAAADRYAFEIDADMRIVQVPSAAAVVGVEGDRCTNRVSFRLPREYRGTDLSGFSVQVSYVNAGGELGVYDAGKPTVEADGLSFEWLVEEPVTRYVGAVRFAAKLYDADERGTVLRQYSSTVGTVQCLEGLDVDAELPEDVTKSLIAQLTGMAEASAKRANEAASKAEAAADGANEAASRAAGNILRAEASGALCHADDAFRAKPLGLTIYGRSVQDGTPSPDSPKPIASVTEAALKVCGKNLFGDVGIRTVNGLTFSQEEDGSVTVKGTPTKAYSNIRCDLGTGVLGRTVTVACTGNVGNGAADPGAVYPQITIENATGANTNAGLYANMEKLTMDIPSDARGASIIISCGEDTTQARDARLKVIASIGRSAEDYEPYVSASVPIDLKGRELCSLPNGVRDEVRVDSAGNVELVKRVGKVVVSGVDKAVDSGVSSRGAHRYFAIILRDAPGKEYAYGANNAAADKLIHLADYIGMNLDCFYVNNISVVFGCDKQTDVEFITWINSVSPTVLYELAEPQVTHIGKVDMPALPAPVCNAWVESDVPTECAVRYVRDVNIVIAKLEKQLAAVASAAI